MMSQCPTIGNGLARLLWDSTENLLEYDGKQVLLIKRLPGHRSHKFTNETAFASVCLLMGGQKNMEPNWIFLVKDILFL